MKWPRSRFLLTSHRGACCSWVMRAGNSPCTCLNSFGVNSRVLGSVKPKAELWYCTQCLQFWAVRGTGSDWSLRGWSACTVQGVLSSVSHLELCKSKGLLWWTKIHGHSDSEHLAFLIKTWLAWKHIKPEVLFELWNCAQFSCSLLQPTSHHLV